MVHSVHSGSEVHLMVQAHQELAASGVKVRPGFLQLEPIGFDCELRDNQQVSEPSFTGDLQTAIAGIHRRRWTPRAVAGGFGRIRRLCHTWPHPRCFRTLAVRVSPLKQAAEILGVGA